MTVLRWVLFLPAALAASVIAGAFGRFAGAIYSEFIGFTTSGAFSAFAFVMAGMTVAPNRSRTVKWLLLLIAASLGAISAFGSWFSDDRLKMATGISMTIASLLFVAIPHSDVVSSSKAASTDAANGD